ncbi:tripartite tricarboxylate transporter permease [Alkalihalobacillus oceani]|uniref:tripartite tricarboxylate transporter permease n=1 Tax=Halalkalibacter oceani TaxID=1653776 RepID=UPI00203E2166|nr:tripartite tricarboxylate transporter permease [Halalkalibacter oceani]MCM3761124.1 tripartite tricarboxylate transporter permease [Halalkalibacter oceani]
MDFMHFDFSLLFSWEILFAIVLGTLYGLLIGSLPGLGSTVGIALLLPVTYSMSPVAAIIMLAAVYQAGEYGGSISSIVLGVPGTPSATATVLDGSPMAKQGKPGEALGYSITGALIGGGIGAIILLTLSIPLSTLAIRFSDPEFFLLGVLGLVCVAGLSSKDLPKSIISVLLGLMLGMVGLDVATGSARFTFGSYALMDGISMVALLIGMFAVAEVFSMLGQNSDKKIVTDTKNLKTKITWKQFKEVRKTYIKSSFIGGFVGILPGLGAGPASWFAYTEAKRSAKNPDNFGKGEPNGIAAPESANNAAVGGALVPLTTLGIPGSPATAVILGAFLIHGITPGPNVFENQPDLVYSIFWGFLVATIAMYFIGKYTTPLFSSMLKMPAFMLSPIILFIAIMGVYASRINLFDVWIAVVVGIAAYILKKLDFSLPSIILAFILGPIIETSLRRSLLISGGNVEIFFTRTYSLVILLIIVLLIVMLVLQSVKKRKSSPPKNMQA